MPHARKKVCTYAANSEVRLTTTAYKFCLPHYITT